MSYNIIGGYMDLNKLKNDIDKFIGSINIPDISCCEDDTKSYHAYNELDKLYDDNKKEEYNINLFNYDLNELSNKLNVDYDNLLNLYINNQIPSKGLSIAIMMVMGLDINRINDRLHLLKYNLGNSISDKIIRYFIINDIRDIDLLNEILISYGQMYLFSRKKLR